MLPNPVSVLTKLLDHYRKAGYFLDKFSAADEDLLENLQGILDSAIDSENSSFETTTGLEFSSDYGDYAVSEDQLLSCFADDEAAELLSKRSNPTTPLSQESSYQLEDEEIRYNYVPLEVKKRAVEYWESGKTKKLTLKSVKDHFSVVTSVMQLKRWKEQIARGGSKIDKLALITKEMLQRFTEAVHNRNLVHDSDLRRWALKANRTIGLAGFMASGFFITRFKRIHRIVSRKVTKFVTLTFVEEKEDVAKRASQFVAEVVPVIQEVSPKGLYNSDQSGFNLESHTGRTLAFKGVKKVFAKVQSVSATTHSFTIQPTVSADGDLLRLLVCLQEPDGKLGPKVQKTIYEAPNLYVVASKSGKMMKVLLQKWMDHVFVPRVGDKSALMLDDWSAHRDTESLEEAIPPTKTVRFLRIPKGTTSIVQPLDVYFFRPWKVFDRRVCDFVLMEDLDVNLHSRNERLKRQSLIHRQFSAPRFKDIIRYSFYKSGYLKEKPPKFQNPVQFCFGGSEIDCAMCQDNGKFMRCAWCSHDLCFECFYVADHDCNKVM